jgi:ferric-dicitrate binding protein FerR (iron transport regulator)
MNRPDEQLLRRYLAGQVSPEEGASVEAWLAEDPDHWGELAGLQDALTDAALSDTAVDQASANVWSRLRHAVSDETELGQTRGVPRLSPAGRYAIPAARRWATSLRVAAAVAAAMTVGTALTIWLRVGQSAPVPVIRVAATAPGERATLRLPDGTEVLLGVASTLRYPADFGTVSREMALEGEAYFDVVHDVQRPFVVHAGQMMAKDLGTRFTVRHYPEDAGARVVVREGRVAIGAGQGRRTTVVAPGQQGRMERNGALAITTADTSAVFAWLTGRLVMKSVPLGEALPDLGRWFDLDFRLEDSLLADIPLTVSLTSRPTPASLRTLAAALGLDLAQQGRIVTLRATRPKR